MEVTSRDPRVRDVGSPAWGESTGGVLATGERVRLLLRLLPEAAVLFRSQVVVRASWRRGCLTLPIWAVDGPGTPLSDALLGFAEHHYQSRDLYRHVRRSAVFALAVAADQCLDAAPELVWCASLLHDIDLEAPVGGRCFAVRGGKTIRQLALNAGAAEATADALADAVCRHPTPGLTAREHPLAYAVAVGALLDLTGSRIEQFQPASVRALLDAEPRGDIADAIAELWAIESRQVHHGRAWLATCGGFRHAVQHPLLTSDHRPPRHPSK